MRKKVKSSFCCRMLVLDSLQGCRASNKQSCEKPLASDCNFAALLTVLQASHLVLLGSSRSYVLSCSCIFPASLIH